MATTKIGAGVVDLNSDNTSFKMPVGSSSFTGTPVAGMIRNNTSLTNNDAATAFEYYDGTQWVGMGTEAFPRVNFLVIAGAGSGGSGGGAGGGAGGYRTSYGTSGANSPAEDEFPLFIGTTYTITVGAGGSAPGGNSRGNYGSDSVFATITSIGGGSGGGNFGTSMGGGSGGSGGGGGWNASTGGAGTANQGQNGGGNLSQYQGGGGGGASGTGGATGVAGAGLSIDITGTAVTRAQGGSGGQTSSGATGGVNTGSGGGGCYFSNCPAGAGGSGLVVLRMPTADYSGTTTGSPTVTTSGTDTILTYTGSGTYTA
jgi:hypothetical protein